MLNVFDASRTPPESPSRRWAEADTPAAPRRRVHFAGIGGIGMSGIAEILLAQGDRVSGSDVAESEVTRRLVSLGARCTLGHRAELVADADLVVVTSAVSADNVEVRAARALGIPVLHRAEMLATLLHGRRAVAVAGSHGKTTTSSLVASVLTAGELDPTYVIGGWLSGQGTGARLGQGQFAVVEADESDGSLVRIAPEVAVLLNVGRDHLDHFRDLEAIQEVFTTFLNGVPPEGLCVVCRDDPSAAEILARVHARGVTYGLDGPADITARQVVLQGPGSHFLAEAGGRRLGLVRLRIPGIHNVRNALAAIAVGVELGIPFDQIRQGLGEFRGVQRRFEIKGNASGVTIVDDYGHHPTEITATLRAARAAWPDRRLVVAFQPHRYSRTQALGPEFVTALSSVDVLVMTEIYAAGDRPIPGVTAAQIAEGVQRLGHPHVEFIPSLDDIPDRLAAIVRPNDVVLTLGAGDIGHAADALHALLAASRAPRALRATVGAT